MLQNIIIVMLYQIVSILIIISYLLSTCSVRDPDDVVAGLTARADAYSERGGD